MDSAIREERPRGRHAFQRYAVGVTAGHPVAIEDICSVLRKAGVKAEHDMDLYAPPAN